MREWTEKHIRELIDAQLKKLKSSGSGMQGLSFIHSFNIPVDNQLNNLYVTDEQIPDRESGVIPEKTVTFYSTFKSSGFTSWDETRNNVRYKIDNIFAYYPGTNKDMPRPVIAGKKYVSSGGWFVYQDGKYFPIEIMTYNIPSTEAYNYIVPCQVIQPLYKDWTDEEWEYSGMDKEGWTHWKYYNFGEDNRVYFRAYYKEV